MAILKVKDLKKSFGENNPAALHQYARNCGQRLDNR